MKRASSKIVAFGLFLFVQVAQADWTPAKRLTWNSAWSGVPNLAIDSSNTIHVVWEDDISGNREIYYTRSTDGGATWSAAKRLIWNSGESRFPAIAIDGSGTIHIVWDDNTPGNAEIYYRGSSDGGATWSAANRLTWTSGGSYDSVLAIESSDTIHVVWFDFTPGNVELYYKRSSDGGATWSAANRLTWNSGGSYCPAIAKDGSDAIHVVWEDQTPGYSEIYYKKSTDSGTTWSPDIRLTWNSGTSADPVIAIDTNSIIHVVWFDHTPGNPEIYYKNGN
jgi:hypothetical protein